MTTLRQLFFHLQHHGDSQPALLPGEKKEAGDRRLYDRRGNIGPLQDRETRLRFAAQAAGFGLYDLDCISGEIHWSPELKAIAGLPADDAPMSWEQVRALLHPEDRERVVGNIKSALASEENSDIEDEYRLVRPDGTVRWVRARGRTFFGGEGSGRRPLGSTGVVRDITDSRARQQELSESQARLSGLIDSTTDAILSVDAEQRVVLFNPAACRMFRYRAEEIIGAPLDRFIPERYREAHREHARRFLESGFTARAMGQAGNFLGVRSDGEEFPIEATISKTMVNGQWQMTVIIRDVTERRAADEALRHSREELEMAVKGADIGTWTWDMETGAMNWSARCRQLFGIPGDGPMTFQLFLGALLPEDRDKAQAAVARALERREEYNLAHRIVWPDGSRHWVVVVGRGRYDDASGKVVGMGGIALDITERKTIEESLRESEELMRLTNEAASIGTYDIDLASGRTRFSPELCAILGLPAGTELELDAAIGLIHPDDRERVMAAFLKSQDPAGDGLVTSEHRVLRPGGEARWLVWRGRTTFCSEHGGRRPVRNIGACFDITERKRLEEALQEMNEALESRVEERTAEIIAVNEELVRSNLELQQFAYIAAHDLQTPLRSISGFAQLLEKEYQGKLGDQADLWIGQLVNHVGRMHDLIQDLLAYSRIDSPGRPFEPTDFNRVFAEVMDSSLAAIRDSGATVTRDELPTVMGDRIQLAQVLQNLIGNGIKYRGDAQPRVHVSARRQGGEWIISVRDNGIGVALRHHERIFEIFRRLHSQQAYPGTGIGLAICRRVIQRHGGRIWVESEAGQGSTFHFTLPADESPQPADGQAAET